MINTIFVSLLPKTLLSSYMIGVFMELSQKLHPSMYYVLNTHHRLCDRNVIMLMLLSTETSHLNGTAAYDECKKNIFIKIR